MGEVGEVIPEKSTTTTSIETPTISTLTNGELQNGVCKGSDNSNKNTTTTTTDDNNDCVDTEDDSQISSSENGLISETTSDGISNLKKDLLKIDNDSLPNVNKIIKNNNDDKSQSSIDDKSNDMSSENDTADSKLRKTAPSSSVQSLSDDEKKSNGSATEEDEKDETSQDSDQKPVESKISTSTTNHDDDDDDRSREDDAVERMDIDSDLSKTNNDEDNTTQESKTEDNEASKDGEDSVVATKNKDDNDDDLEKNTLSKDELPKEAAASLINKKHDDEKKSDEVENEMKINDKSVKDSTVAEDNNRDDENSIEFPKTNGETTVDKKSMNESKNDDDKGGNTSADDVQLIESDDDEDPFKDVQHADIPIADKKLNDDDDDDDAVIIHSDSENEDCVVIKKNTKSKNEKNTDEDDCVVIDDDDDDDDDDVDDENDVKNKNSLNTSPTTPQNLSMNKDSSTVERRSSNRQRKSAVTVRNFASFDNDDDDDDITEIVDDQPPPSKRPKPNASLNNSNSIGPLNLTSPVGTLTIKDARSLCEPSAKSYQQSFLQSAGVSTIQLNTLKPNSQIPGGNNNNNTNSAFPIGLRPALAQLSNTQMPKLAPVSNLVNSNANLLPALTDDMFVLEAPSFIVPYIYEKPPSNNLKDIVTKLVNEFELHKYKDVKEKKTDLDLLEAAKPKSLNLVDGGDEKTEANNNNNDDDTKKSADKKSKKRKRGANENDDDSWGESDASTDEEASDDETVRTKVLIEKADTGIETIKSALASVEQIAQTKTNNDPLAVPGDSASNSIGSSGGLVGDKLKSENYFDSPLGKFFMDIGVVLVQEYVQTDLLKKVQRRRSRKTEAGAEQAELDVAINALTKDLKAIKKLNEPFKFEMKRCEFCSYKTESALSMANHYETPHMEKTMYKCNFCTFEIRQTQDIIFHMEAVHNIKGRLEKAPSYHMCPNCPFEDNGKSKMARHQPVCVKKFRPELNLCPPQDWEAPAKIPRIKPRHGLVGTATAYQAMAAQAAAQKAALASLQQQQVAARNLIAQNANRNRNNLGGRQNQNKPVRNLPNPMARGGMNNAQLQMRQQQQQHLLPQNVVLPNNYQIQGGQLVQVAGSGLAILPNAHNSFTFQSQQKKGGQQPSISITPLPRQSNLSVGQNLSSPSSSGSSQHQSMPINAKPGLKPGQSPSGNKTSFVICEICDGYIKDLEQLRNHMQWMHKVKIHPKMIYNRPPLNCQKCQFRFFTDQGLERHLLGSHGLVTSSMQEAANKGKDAGRCPVCGRMYQWKLLNHVSRDHNMTLKPAHLSYKCTVCTATFGMYKQFENHVYTAHSTVAKKAMANDGKKNNNNNSNSNSSSSNNNNSNINSNQNRNLSGTNDSLLKPLRINDEITIIPQPATKKT